MLAGFGIWVAMATQPGGLQNYGAFTLSLGADPAGHPWAPEATCRSLRRGAESEGRVPGPALLRRGWGVCMTSLGPSHPGLVHAVSPPHHMAAGTEHPGVLASFQAGLPGIPGPHSCTHLHASRPGELTPACPHWGWPEGEVTLGRAQDREGV